MGDSALGALAAVTASALFSAGLVLQSLEARTVPAEHSLRLSLIGGLLGRRRWVLGGLLMVLGFGFHVGALLLAPLTVVQPSLAACPQFPPTFVLARLFRRRLPVACAPSSELWGGCRGARSTRTRRIYAP